MNPPNNITEGKYTEEEVKACVEMLNHLVTNSGEMAHLSRELRVELLTVTGQLSRPARDEIRKRRRDSKKVERKRVINYERNLRAATGIRSAREASVFTAPLRITSDEAAKLTPPELVSPRDCYICKRAFTKVHFFYDAMCPSCAEFNYAKRFQTAPMDGQTALITGSRLKIGYQSTVMMLRAGARVIATTRFPVDSALRFAKEPDFIVWRDRLHIYGLDLRHTPSVEIFCNYIEQKYDRLDVLINNAAQTVRRPPGFYSHLIENEKKKFEELPEGAQQLLSSYDTCKREIFSQSKLSLGSGALAPVTWGAKMPGIGLSSSAALSQIPYSYDQGMPVEQVFPKGQLDADLQQVDMRANNTWRLRLGEVPTAELLELHLINAIAPFVLCNRLSAMMKRDNTGKKHIVNVSAMEGKFLRYVKTDRHPHTNMAKAALNMLTHTSASDLVKYGIFMNSVDTGWVTDEDPFLLSQRKQEMHDFQPPLDIVDGAARVCDPFFDGINTGKHWCGKFLKDYFPIDW